MATDVKFQDLGDSEDVVFEHSPLYKHLSDVGFTDFDVESVNATDERLESCANKNFRQNNGENPGSRNLKEWAVNLIERFVFGYFSSSRAPEEISCYTSCVVMIKSSGLLTDDDLELLYRFEQCTDTRFDCDIDVTVEQKLDENNSDFTEANNSSLLNLVANKLMIGITMLVAIILGLLLNANFLSFKNLSYVFLTIIGICLPLQLYFLRVKTRFCSHKETISLLSNYIQFINKLLVLMRKVILFIQEKELVARGHIIVNPAAPVTRLETKIKRCLILRKCLRMEMDNFISLLRNKIKHSSNSRIVRNNYASIRWLQKELGRIENECLTQSGEDLETDECSLRMLKKSFATLGSHQSILLCSIALNLMMEIICLRESGTNESNLGGFKSCLGDLLEKGKVSVENITQCYTFHKVEIPVCIFDENQGDAPSEKTVYSPLATALRSITLHLQHACQISIETEEKLDRVISKSIIDSDCTDLQEINEQLVLIEQELERLNVCLEESQNRLERTAVGSIGNERGKNFVEEKPNVLSIEKEEKNVVIISLAEEVDPVPDQIFEGETTSEFDREGQYSPNVGREELLREEKMREESRHLLLELKSVLATKDEGKMVGIPRLLLSKKLGTVKREDDVETSGEVEVLRLTLEPSQSEREEKDGVNETRSLQSFDGDSDIKYQTVDSIQSTTNPCKNLDHSLQRYDNPRTEIKDDDDASNSSRESTTNDEPSDARLSHANPFASMVAAAAMARNRQCGLTEQRYEIEGETSSDESDTNM